MKLKLDIEDVEVPKKIEEEFYKWLRDNPEKEDAFIPQTDWERFYRAFSEKYKDTLAPKEWALLIRDITLNTIAFGGGYPKYKYMELNVLGKKIIVMCFFWDSFEKYEEPYLIAFEENGR